MGSKRIPPYVRVQRCAIFAASIPAHNEKEPLLRFDVEDADNRSAFAGFKIGAQAPSRRALRTKFLRGHPNGLDSDADSCACLIFAECRPNPLADAGLEPEQRNSKQSASESG